MLDRGASVIALSMLRRNAEPSMAARRRGQFIASLMRPGAAIDEREATEMAAELGFGRRACAAAAAGGDPGFEAAGAPSRRAIAAPSAGGALWRDDRRASSPARRVPAVAGVLPRAHGLGMIVAVASRSESASSRRGSGPDRAHRCVRVRAQSSAAGARN